MAVWVFGDAQITGTKNFLFDTSEASSYVAEVSKILGNQACCFVAGFFLGDTILITNHVWVYLPTFGTKNNQM